VLGRCLVVQWATDCQPRPVEHMGVNHCRSHIFVPKQFLNIAYVAPVLKQMRGETVPKGMAAGRFRHSGLSHGNFHRVLKVLFLNMMAPCLLRAWIDG